MPAKTRAVHLAKEKPRSAYRLRALPGVCRRQKNDTLARALKHKQKRKPRTRIARRGSRLVPVVGLEPTRCHHRRILNPLRLPFHHTGTLSKSISHSRQNIKCFVAIFYIHCRLFLYSRQWISMRFDIVLYIEPRGVALAPIGFGFLRVPGAQLIVFENVVHEICGVLL